MRSPLHNLRAFVLAPLAVMGAAVAAYATFLRRADLPFFGDWGYFNALSLVVRSSVLAYGRMPVHNPWACGGMDLLANPQSRVFSPLLLADVVLPPQWANLTGLMAYSALGLFGMSLLLRRLGIGPGIAFAGGVLFINGEWFGLHYTEGHIPFGSMQLLPLLVYFAMTCGRRRSLLLLVLTLVLFLLDGGIYTIIFALLLLSTVLCLGLVRRLELRAAARRPAELAVLALAASLLALPKVLPVLSLVGDRHLEFFTMPAELLEKSLFTPFHFIDDQCCGRVLLGYQEYGCYLSLPGLALIAIGGGRPLAYWKRAWRFLAAALFWLWVASGWWVEANPWKLFQKLPLVNNAHVQARLLLLVFLFFVIMVSLALQMLRARGRAGAVAAALVALGLCSESWLVRNYPMKDDPDYGAVSPSGLIVGTTITSTEPVGWSVQHYYTGAGSASCYEPTFQPQNIMFSGQPGYRGEAFLEDPGAGKVRLLEYTPGRITLRYELLHPGAIILNTNSLLGWQAREPEFATVSGRGTDLLRVEPKNLSGEVHLRYWPRHMPWLLASFASGLALFGWLWSRSRCQTGVAGPPIPRM